MQNNARQQRLDTVISCNVPDQVPFCINTNDFYATKYNLTNYNVMKDARFFRPALKQFARDYNPDFIAMPITYPMDALSLAQFQNVRYPGPDFQLPVDTPYQYIDSPYMEEDDYEVYLKDPSAFLFKNVFAKHYKAYAAVGNLSVQNLCSGSIYSMAAFGNPYIKEALLKMIQTGEIVSDYLQQIGAIAKELEDMGYPVYGLSGVLNPFDAFADNVRGIMDTNVDILSCPEEVEEVLKRWGDEALPGTIFAAKSSGNPYAFMPLHCGGEAFMSLDNFKEYYWPHVKRYAMALIENGMTPILFCEGSYTSRLDVLADMPEGKVIYLFEDVDLKKAKKALHKKACIMGGMQTQTLMFGTPKQVQEETKQILDICAPDGGFIMCNSIALDHAKEENLAMWRETVELHGKY